VGEDGTEHADDACYMCDLASVDIVLPGRRRSR